VINPYESVPSYYENGRGVFESINIAEFFDERLPGQGTQLMPTDPFLRAAIREVCIRLTDPKNLTEKLREIKRPKKTDLLLGRFAFM